MQESKPRQGRHFSTEVQAAEMSTEAKLPESVGKSATVGRLATCSSDTGDQEPEIVWKPTTDSRQLAKNSSERQKLNEKTIEKSKIFFFVQ
jgi:hypothetical protein